MELVKLHLSVFTGWPPTCKGTRQKAMTTRWAAVTSSSLLRTHITRATSHTSRIMCDTFRGQLHFTGLSTISTIAPSDWDKQETSSASYFWRHKATGETRWEPPHAPVAIAGKEDDSACGGGSCVRRASLHRATSAQAIQHASLTDSVVSDGHVRAYDVLFKWLQWKHESEDKGKGLPLNQQDANMRARMKFLDLAPLLAMFEFSK